MTVEVGTKTGGQLFFEAAAQYGLDHTFGNPGTTEVNFMDALSQSPQMQFFLCLHEDVAAGAADGFARIKGWPALINLHLFPGLAHGLANLHNAKRARVPVIVTVGEHHTGFGLEESPLAGDIMGAARSLFKWSYHVATAAEIPAALHRAMLKALTPPQGPVCLVLPNNLLGEMVQGEISIPTLNVPRPGPAHPQAIDEAARLLQGASKPLIVVGEVYNGAGQHALLEIAALTSATVWREPFPTRLDPLTDPLMAVGPNRLPYFPKQRRQILRNADLLLLAGVSGFTTHFLYEEDPVIALVPDRIPIIHLDTDADELGKNAKSALPLLGDIDLTLAQLLGAMQARMSQAKPTSPVEVSKPNTPFVPDDSSPITPAILGQALRAGLPEGTILVDESITAGTGMNAELVPGNSNLAHILTVRGGSLGTGIPASIGVQLAAPGKPVVAVIGDGTALYSIQALWTLARYKLPVVVVICNNHNYDIITLEILRSQGALANQGIAAITEYTGLTPPGINFAALAEGFGVAGKRLSRPSDLVPALQAAFASGQPYLLDVELASSLKPR